MDARALFLRWCLALGLGAAVSPAVAQQVPFRNLTTGDGLGNEIVRAALQDADGYLWFGTEDGATRYDGAALTTFRTPSGLAGNRITAIAADATGALWFASGSAGVTRYADGTFTAVDVAGSGGALALLVDRAGAVWSGWDGLSRFDGTSFERVPVEGDELGGGVFALFEDASGRLWTGTDEGYQVAERTDGGLRRIAGGGGAWVSSFAEDAAGTIWMGTNDGLKRFPAGAAPGDPPAPPPAELRGLSRGWIRSLFVDAGGALWIGTNAAGAFRYAPDGRVEQYTVVNGLAGNAVLRIAQDEEGSLWFATTTGVSRLSTRQFLRFTVRDGLVHNIAMCIVQDDSGDYWVGTAQGVSRITQGTIVNRADGYGLGDTFALFSLRDRRGGVWFGSERGASRLVGDRFETFGPADGWENTGAGWNRGRSIWQDDRDWIWFANDWGLSVYKDGRFHTYSWPAGRDSLGCAVLADLKGNVWLGFHSGNGILRLAVTDPGEGLAPRLETIAHYRAPDDLPDGRVVSRERDRDGNVWFGTRTAGAVRFTLEGNDVVRTDRYWTGNGLADDYVRTIRQDSRGTVWLGTDQGVDGLPPRPEGRTPFRHLGREDGLASSVVQFVYEDDRGDLWFCTTNGVCRYTPDGDVRPPVEPRVHVTSFSVRGEPDSVALRAGMARLPHDRHSVAFQFSAATFRSDRPPRFRYRLDGMDDDWSTPTASRHVNYPHLPPGNYVFRVVAGNADGLWSREPATFRLVIEPPFWRRAWFLLLAVACVAALLYGAHRLRVRRILALRGIRDRIAADLHDEVGSTLSSISILSELALRSPAPGKGDLLERIHRDSREMLEAMDDIVWMIRPHADEFGTLVERMRRFGAGIVEPTGATFRLDVDGAGDARVPMACRRDLYLVFKEAVTNAARHAGGRAVRASLHVDERSLVLRVSDDGRGMTAEPAAPGGDGLANMARRAASLRGSLDVDTAPGGGTRITLDVPMRRGRRRT